MASSRSTTMAPSSMLSSVHMRTQTATAAASTTALPLKMGSFWTEPMASRMRTPIPQHPEDVIASRYLHRLGNVFIRSSPKECDDVAEAVADNVVAAEHGNTGGGAAPSRRQNLKSGSLAHLASSHLSPLTGSHNGTPMGDAMAPTAAANRRWRQRIASPEVSGACEAAPRPFPSTPTPKSAIASLSPSGDQSQAIHIRDDAFVSWSSLSGEDPKKGKRQRHGGTPVTASSGSSTSDRNTQSGHCNSHPRGTEDTRSGQTCPLLTSHDSKESTCSSSISSYGGSEKVYRPDPPSAAVRHAAAKSATAGEKVVAKAQQLVEKAAELVARAALPPRKVRSKEQRSAQVLAQEHNKVLLMVGRKANVESDIEDMLTVADAAKKKAEHARLAAIAKSRAGANAVDPSASAVVTGPGSGKSPKRVKVPTGASPTLEPSVVRRQLQIVGNELMRNGGTDLTASHIRHQVQELEKQLCVVEELLQSDLAAAPSCEVESQLPNGIIADASKSATLRRPVKSVRKQVEESKREVEGLLEVSSNFERMEWLLESVETEMLTDLEEPLAQPSDEVAAARRQSLHQGLFSSATAIRRSGSDTAGAPRAPERSVKNSLGRRQPSLQGGVSKLRSLKSSNTVTREWVHGDTGKTLPYQQRRTSDETTITEPSFVEFAISDAGGYTSGCLQSQGKETRTVSATSLTPSATPPRRLNLLNFMAEVLAEYEQALGLAARTPGTRQVSTSSVRCDDRASTPFTNQGNRTQTGSTGERLGEGLSGASQSPQLPGYNTASWALLDAVELRDGRGLQGLSSGGFFLPSSLPSRGQMFTEGGDLSGQHRLSLVSLLNSEAGELDGDSRHDVGKQRKVLLGAQLRDLRAGLLHDLYKLYALHDYVHLIEARHQELSGGVVKSEAEYAAELEQKLEEHRLQLEAAQRAREEEARRKAEEAALDHQWGQSVSRSRLESLRRSQSPATSPRPTLVDDVLNVQSVRKSSALVTAGVRGSIPSPAEKEPHTAESRRSIEEVQLTAASEASTGPTETQTEVLREFLEVEGLLFTVVRVEGRPPSMEEEEAAENAASAASGKRAKKRGYQRQKPKTGAQLGSIVHYEVRAERPLSSVSPAADDTAAVTEASFTDAGNSVAAIVHIISKSLTNAKVSPNPETAMTEEDQGPRFCLYVRPGAPPQCVVTVTPSHPRSKISFGQVFKFCASDFATEQRLLRQGFGADDSWDAPSALSPVLVFPTSGNGLHDSSRSASLDSRTLHSPEVVTGLVAVEAPRQTATGVAQQGEPGEKKVKTNSQVAASSPGDAAATERRPLSQKASKHVKITSPDKQVSVDAHAAVDASATTLAPPTKATVSSDHALGRDGTPTKRKSLHGANVAAAMAAKPEPSPADVPGLLPTTPPLSLLPRDVEDWGVPHASSEMEAVEKNAVVLTALQVEEGGAVLRGLSASTSGDNDVGTVTSAVQELLAFIPDDAIRAASEAGVLTEGSQDPAAAVHILASEILRQVVADGDNTSELHPEKTDTRIGSSRSDREGDKGANDTAQSVEDAEAARGGSNGGVVGAAEDFPVERLSASPARLEPQPQLPSLSTPAKGSAGHHRNATTSSATTRSLASRNANSPQQFEPRPGSSPAPSIAISSSQSRPLRAEDIGNYGEGGIRFDVPLAGDEPVKPQLTPPIAAKPKLPTSFSHKQRPIRVRKERAAVAHREIASEATAQLDGDMESASPLQEDFLVPPPKVVVLRTPGLGKKQMLLPQEAAANLLGPSLPETLCERPISKGKPKLPDLPNVERGEAQGNFSRIPGSAHSATPLPPPPLHSVLPTTGAAAEAAADVETVSHVQNFLRSVVAGSPLHGMVASDGVSTGVERRPVHSGKGSTKVAIRTELTQLQEDAKELFMMDPVRYDTVISELMGQAARALQPTTVEAAASATKERKAEVFPTVSGTRVAAAPPTLILSDKPMNASFGISQKKVPQSDMDVKSDGALVSPSREASPRSIASPSFPAEIEPPKDGERGQESGVDLRLPDKRFSSVIARQPGGRAALGSVVSIVSLAPSFVNSTADPTQTLEENASITLLNGSDHGRQSSMQPLPCAVSARRSVYALAADGDKDATPTQSQSGAAAEVERILFEQMKAQLLLRSIITKMKEMWSIKQKDVEAKRRERVARQRRCMMQRALAAVWPLERHRVLHLHKLIYLLDRQVGRVHGWLPHYADNNVLVDVAPADVPRLAGGAATLPYTAAPVHASMNSWYRQRDEVKRDADKDRAGGAAAHFCPRYLRYLPQQHIFHFMRLAKERHLLPLRLVQADVQRSHNQHLLLGYAKLTVYDEGTADPYSTRLLPGWPQRRLPRLPRGSRNALTTTFTPRHYEDMRDRGERARFLRRLQRTAAFQGISKTYSPRQRQDADLPFTLH